MFRLSGSLRSSGAFRKKRKKGDANASFLSRWFGRVPRRTSRTYPSLDAVVSLVKNLSLKQDAFVDFGNSAFDKTLSPVRTLGAAASFRFAFMNESSFSTTFARPSVRSNAAFSLRFRKRRRVEKVGLKKSRRLDASDPKELARLTFPEPVFPAFFRTRHN